MPEIDQNQHFCMRLHFPKYDVDYYIGKENSPDVKKQGTLLFLKTY